MKKLRLNAREIVRDIRQLCSDGELIEKYNLSASSLAKVKIKLLEKGWLTESDLASSASEANPGQVGGNWVRGGSEESTEVDLVQDLTERVALISDLTLRATNRGAAEAGLCGGRGGIHPYSGQESMRRRAEQDPTSLCPKCGTVRDSPTADTCIHCGVVFAKYEKSLKKAGIAIWY